MTLKSMTGFARSDGPCSGGSWYWEVRSVNGRGLDLRLRLPPGFEALEPKVRDIITQRLVRGSVSATLNVTREGRGARIMLNEAALTEVLRAAARVQQLTGGEPPRADAILSIRGVLEVAEQPDAEAASEGERETILIGLTKALDDIVAARAAEGVRLRAVLLGQLAEIERLVAVITASPMRTPEAVKARLAEQIARMIEAPLALDAARLHQEAVLLATRADVSEELQRLASHVDAARDLLADNAPVGRKLDFLAQEFNREANTLCAKSNDGDITRAGLALKAVIDQMREQVQNIE